MFSQKLPPVSQDKRSIMREVALAYRRAERAAKAEGCLPPEHHRRGYEAARVKYLELDSDAPADWLEAAARVSEMIAYAIRANTDWFWRGPDAWTRSTVLPLGLVTGCSLFLYRSGWVDSPTTTTCWRRRLDAPLLRDHNTPAARAPGIKAIHRLVCASSRFVLIVKPKPKEKRLKAFGPPAAGFAHRVSLVHRHRADDACDEIVDKA